jgi:FkbM family methyltransferase
MKNKGSNIKSKFQSIFFTLFNRLENNNNAEFSSNGEEHFLNEYFSSLSGNVTLFDIGGNIGGYSDILVEQCGKQKLNYTIHIFEPTQSCFSILQKKFSDNHHIRLNNAGVSDSETTAEIFYDAEKSGFASLYQRDLSFMDVQLNIKENISLIRLDEYLVKNAIGVIDFLKIDIEGHELAAFRGMGAFLSGEHIKAIQFEYGGANLDSGTTLRELYSVLEQAGFVLAKIMKNGIEVRPYLTRMENYQYSNYVAFSKKFFPSLR